MTGLIKGIHGRVDVGLEIQKYHRIIKSGIQMYLYVRRGHTRTEILAFIFLPFHGDGLLALPFHTIIWKAAVHQVYIIVSADLSLLVSSLASFIPGTVRHACKRVRSIEKIPSSLACLQVTLCPCSVLAMICKKFVIVLF